MGISQKYIETFHGITVVMAATLIHFTYGYFYTLGNMAPYLASVLKKHFPEFQDGSTVWLSAGSLAAQGLFMPLGGILAPKIGFRSVVLVGCLLNSCGTLLTYFTLTRGFIYLFLTYSLMTGMGLGFSYSVVLVVAATWFPNRRALIYGIVTGGFGLGGIIYTPIQKALINPNNILINETTRKFSDDELLDRVPWALLILGIISAVIQSLGFCILRPRSNCIETHKESKHSITNKRNKENFNEQDNNEASLEKEISDSFPIDCSYASDLKEVSLTPGEVIRRHEFYLLWFIMLCIIIPVTLVTATYKVIGAVYIENDAFLSGVATVSALFNSFGRVVWGAICDKFSFKLPIMVLLLSWATILLTLPHIFYYETAQMTLYAIWICILFFILSGAFALMPAATSQLFGAKNLAVNYGLVFSAFVIGSLVCGLVSEQTEGHWTLLFTVCGVFCIVASFLLMWIHDPWTPDSMNLCKSCSSVCQRIQPRGENPTEPNVILEL